MASNEELTIVSAAIPQDTPDADSSIAETTPLVVKNSVVRSGLLRRLKESVLIKSKAANMILVWSALMYLLYGILLNPDNVFTMNISLNFVIMMESVAYALIAIWLLFYPLAGYLADIRYGRYSVVIFGIRFTWKGLIVLVVVGAVITAIFFGTLDLMWESTAWAVCMCLAIGFLSVLGVVALFMLLIGFSAFAANVIQFGIDQLQDLPARDSFLFIHWFLMAMYIGIAIGKLALSSLVNSAYVFIFGWAIIGLTLLFLLIALPITLYISKPKWFVIDSGVGNPYRKVAQVVRFARRHKIPIQRSAFTYWEDDIPTGLDLGKSKYGGPFTTEQVENVKAFFGISFILLSLGPFFTADIAASAILPILRNHMMASFLESFNLGTEIAYSMFGNGGTLYPIFIVILIPIFLKLIYPLFQKYIPNILKRIGIGLCLITLSLICSLLVDSIGHALPNGQKATSIFNPFPNYYFDFQTGFVDCSLQFNPYYLVIQNLLLAVAYILIYGGVFEFICAQSPHSMKGFLIGVFFAVKGLFQLIGVLGILLPFSFWQDWNRVGLVYFLVNILISIAGVVAFLITARRYQYRKREEVYDGRKFIEEVYEKDVNHNTAYEDLDVDFNSDSDEED